MDFAPYQSSPPEHNRPFSPPMASNPTSPRTSLDRRPYSPLQYQHQQQQQRRGGGFNSPPPLQHPQPQRSWQQSALPTSYPAPAAAAAAVEGGYRDGVSEFDTSLGIRLDYEACLAYLALPPLGAIILLILERNSDFVR
ncbi:hypothetical protein MGN70_014787 [Eutypa lata]|nr:hypothetical protein MGN70_014787 [Eutypa lata]